MHGSFEEAEAKKTTTTSSDQPKLLETPVIILNKIRDFEKSITDLIRLELNLKEDNLTNPLINSYISTEDDLTEEGMKNKAKLEKKQQRQERKTINKERTAATERNEVIIVFFF